MRLSENLKDNTLIIQLAQRIADRLLLTMDEYRETPDLQELYDSNSVSFGTIGALVKSLPAHDFDQYTESVYAINILVSKMDYDGMWDAVSNSLFVSVDLLESGNKRDVSSVLTHELRHALDDFKSSYRAGSPGSRYADRPIKKGGDPYEDSKMEMNARFVQALELIGDDINKASPAQLRVGSTSKTIINNAFKRVSLDDTTTEYGRRLLTRAFTYYNVVLNARLKQTTASE